MKFFLIVLALVSPLTFATDGLIKIKSSHSVKETLDKLESKLKEKKMTIFTRINHSQGASKVGLQLRETELLIFGNPKIGTKLMNCDQRFAMDLPQKALAWKDKNGQVWLAYNNPSYLADRYHSNNCVGAIVAKISKALKGFATYATK